MQQPETPKAPDRGIGYWMERVVAERDKSRASLVADAVHDLRVAIRRCRSLGEGFERVDGDPLWRKMRKAGKSLFSALGTLRDTQVLLEWIAKLQPQCPAVAERLRTHCLLRERALKAAAAQAVDGFDTRRWLEWAPALEGRARRLANRPAVFEVLALERYREGRELQAQALRNRSQAALHRLRIGIKKFRYLIENFLPDHDRRWGKDLKQLQDLLGEVHDLDVLWGTTRQAHAYASPDEARLWHAAILSERLQRVQTFRQKMVGPNSLWKTWRSELPAGDVLRRAVLLRFQVWAETLDPNPARTRTVAACSLRLYDALNAMQRLPAPKPEEVLARDLLYVAAIAREVGRTAPGQSYQKRSRRLLESLEPPPGWSGRDLLVAGLVVRYHRGALPHTQRSYAALPIEQRRLVDSLAGILRLSAALAGEKDGSLGSIELHPRGNALEIAAQHYLPRSRQAERIAAARHLLEDACGLAIVIRVKGRADQNELKRTTHLAAVDSAAAGHGIRPVVDASRAAAAQSRAQAKDAGPAAARPRR
jgi:CHAD domain-containing protein